MGKASSDTLIRLGSDAAFEDTLRAFYRILMVYFGVFPFLGGFFFFDNLIVAGKLLGWGLLLAVAIAILLKVVGLIVRIELVMDRERQQLLLRRKVLGFTQLISLAGVEDLYAVITAGETPAAPTNYWWDYVTLLITRSGRRFRAARHGKDFASADRSTRKLGKELGIEVLDGYESHKVEVIPSCGESPTVRVYEFGLKGADGCAMLFWAFIAYTSPFLLAALFWFSD